MIIRLMKVVMVASCALFALLVTFGNLVDYGSNYTFVRHTLSMDTTFPRQCADGRAVTFARPVDARLLADHRRRLRRA